MDNVKHWAKYEARKNTLCKSADKTVSIINDGLKKEYNIKRDIVSFNPEIIETFVKDYYDVLVMYKKKHNYSENGFINNSKIAGIFLYIIIRNGVDDLFIINDSSFEKSGIKAEVAAFFCWHFVCSFVGADENTTKDKYKRKLFYSAIVNVEANTTSDANKVSYDFSCVVFEWFRDAYGDTRFGTND